VDRCGECQIAETVVPVPQLVARLGDHALGPHVDGQRLPRLEPLDARQTVPERPAPFSVEEVRGERLDVLRPKPERGEPRTSFLRLHQLTSGNVRVNPPTRLSSIAA